MRSLPTLTDSIAEYIKRRVAESPHGYVEIRRNDLAERFQCVPSQVTYVLATRFHVRTGFVVESRRGGGGYIRVVRLPSAQNGLARELYRLIGSRIGSREAREIVLRLRAEGLIGERETRLISGAVDDRTLRVLDFPWRNLVRASILKEMLSALLHEAAGPGSGRRAGKGDEGTP